MPDDMIARLREPTEAMLNAARDWSQTKYGKPIGNDDARSCWNVMFDASALPKLLAVAEAARKYMTPHQSANENELRESVLMIALAALDEEPKA